MMGMHGDVLYLTRVTSLPATKRQSSDRTFTTTVVRGLVETTLLGRRDKHGCVAGRISICQTQIVSKAVHLLAKHGEDYVHHVHLCTINIFLVWAICCYHTPN